MLNFPTGGPEQYRAGMIDIFYKSNGQILVSQSETSFSTLNRGDVVWIDLFNPSGEEKRAAEDFLGTNIQSRAQAEEIVEEHYRHTAQGAGLPEAVFVRVYGVREHSGAED